MVPAQAAGPAQTWYWSEDTMNAAIRADYGYDPTVAPAKDPWHYELRTVQCTGGGPFVGRTGPRHFQRFVCTLTYAATDPTIADYVDRMAARVTGRDEHEEDRAPAAADPARPATGTDRALLGFRDWAPVDIDGANPPSLLVKPRTLLLLGPARVLSDSPSIGRVTWRRWGQARLRQRAQSHQGLCPVEPGAPRRLSRATVRGQQRLHACTRDVPPPRPRAHPHEHPHVGDAGVPCPRPLRPAA